MTNPIILPGSPHYGARWVGDKDGKLIRAKGRNPVEVVNPPVLYSQPRFYKSRLTANLVTAPVVDRSGLNYDVDLATLATTGCVDLTLITTTQSADITYSTSGTSGSPIIIQNIWYTGKVSITAKWVTFKNCFFMGNPTNVGPPIQCTNANVEGIKIIDSTIWAQNPQNDCPAVKGHHVSLERVYIRGCTDGIAHIGIGSNGTATGDYTNIDQNIELLGCYVERMAYVSPDPGAAGGLKDNASHLDVGVQFRGGRGLNVRGCVFKGWIDSTINQGGKLPKDTPAGTHVDGNKYATPTNPSLWSTSVFMFSPKLGELDNVRINNNFMDGATAYINMPTSHTAPGSAGVEVTNNRVTLDHQAILNPPMNWLIPSYYSLTLSGNIVVDSSNTPTGATANVRRNS